jgi:AcrR family transcriptional regulator
MKTKNNTIQYPRRKERTNKIRIALLEAAVLRFSTKGYKYTTLAEIARLADVHVQTLYRLFKSKEELAEAAAEQGVSACRQHFEEAQDGQNAFQIWRGWIEKTVSFLSSKGFVDHKQRQLLAPSSLMNDNYIVILYAGYENLLTEYLAKDFGLKAEDSHLPRLAACTLWSGNEAAIKRCAGLDTGEKRLTDPDFLLRESLRTVDETERLFSRYLK